MRKSYYYVVAAMFMTMSFSGCSSEEDDIDDKEGICLSFRLLNERGKKRQPLIKEKTSSLTWR